jgi:hypothetical protein
MAPTPADPESAIREILRLRRVEQRSDPAVRDEIATTREFLEDVIGPTVRPAVAARLLGITQPALHRWLEKGDIGTVISREGRREIPLPELLDLLEEVDEVKREIGHGRPLARVMTRRRRHADESVDLDRLVPSRRRRTHRVSELHSLAYHRLVAERLDENLIARARRRLERWIREDRIHPDWAQEWRRVLSLPPKEVASEIASDSVRARELRQTSPFAGALTEAERKRLTEAIEQRYG